MKNGKKIIVHDNVALEFWEVWRTVLTVNQTRNRVFDLRVFTEWQAEILEWVFYDKECEFQHTDRSGQVSSLDNWHVSPTIFLACAPYLGWTSQQT